MVIWTLMFLNAAGSWLSWLALGPFLTVVSESIVAFGIIALIRQIWSLGGTLAGDLFHSTDPLKNNIWAESLLFALNAIAFIVILNFPGETTALWAPYWAACRYFIGGLSIVYSFQLLMQVSNKESSIVGQLAINQGSIIIAGLAAFLLARFGTGVSLPIAIGVDLLTSGIYLIWLHTRKQMEFEKVPIRLNKNLLQAFTKVFTELKTPITIGFFGGLVALSGLPSILLYFAMKKSNLNSWFSIYNLSLGASLIIFSLLIQRIRSHEILFSKISALSVITILAYYLIFRDEIFFPFTLIVTSAFFLLILHRQVIGSVPADVAASTRASMVVYLNIIFGLSELLFCWLIQNNQFPLVVGLKAVGIAVFLFFGQIKNGLLKEPGGSP